MAAASSTADRRARQIESRFQRMNKSLNSQFVGLGRSMAGAFAGAASIRAAQQLIDASTRIQNALKVTGLAGEDLNKVYDKLFASAQRNAVPLEALVSLYGRAAQAQSTLKASTEELTQLSETVAMAMRVQGGDAQAASGALLQLGQALSNGVVQAEEYNSMLDSMYPLLQAAAAGMKEAGGDVATLTRLVKDGQVSSEAFFRAIEAGSYTLEEKLAGAELTVSQAFVRLQNVLVDTAREFNEGSGASERLADAIEDLAGMVESFDWGPIINGTLDFIDGVRGAVEWVLNLTNALNQLGQQWGKALGTDRIGKSILGELQDSVSQSRVDNAFSNGSTPTTDRLGPATAGPTVLPQISIKDYALPARGGGGGGKKGRAGGARQNDYEREVQQLRDRIALTQAMTAAQAELNPLVDDYGFSLERAATIVELENAAKRAGLEITPQLRQQIEELAGAYATATAEAARLAEEQDRVRQTAEEMRELGKNVMGGFIQDMMNGVDATEALANALGKVADKLLEMALNSLFSGTGSRGGGLLGGVLIPGILHSGGVAGKDGYGHGRAVSPSVFTGAKRYHRGGVAGLQPGEVPAILQKGEVVLPRGAQMGAQPQQVEVTVSGVFVDDNGVVRAQVTQMGAQAAQAGATIAVRQVNQGLPSMLADAQARKM